MGELDQIRRRLAGPGERHHHVAAWVNKLVGTAAICRARLIKTINESAAVKCGVEARRTAEPCPDASDMLPGDPKAVICPERDTPSR